MTNKALNTHIVGMMKASSKKYTPATNVAIARNFREIGKLNDDIIKEREKMEIEYLEMDESGKVEVSENGSLIAKEGKSLKEYNDKIKELLEDEVEVEIKKVSMEKIAKEKEVTANDLILLDFMIVDDEE